MTFSKLPPRKRVQRASLPRLLLEKPGTPQPVQYLDVCLADHRLPTSLVVAKRLQRCPPRLTWPCASQKGGARGVTKLHGAVNMPRCALFPAPPVVVPTWLIVIAMRHLWLPRSAPETTARMKERERSTTPNLPQLRSPQRRPSTRICMRRKPPGKKPEGQLRNPPLDLSSDREPGEATEVEAVVVGDTAVAVEIAETRPQERMKLLRKNRGKSPIFPWPCWPMLKVIKK